ncbi:probable protein DYAD at N-terminal half [Coccomyxa sp. Obi]|nr:probable protein DYAD at N-terminal half [Coccomyxa sp. Obi]
MQNPGASSEFEAAAGMAQLAASGSYTRPFSPPPTADTVGGAMQNWGAALIALSRKIPIEMADVDSWSMHVRSITGPAELQAAMRDFERNVERAVHMEQRAQQTPVKSERLRRKASESLATERTQSTISVTSTQPSESKREGKKELHHGRWSRERYDGAVAALVHILRAMNATSSDQCVLRPALREEARKAVGDTGLLDHLLKHLADKTVTTAGDKLRRRHNTEGHMEYWLQSPASAQTGTVVTSALTPIHSQLAPPPPPPPSHRQEHLCEEEELQQDAAGLAGEFREVRRLRRLLAAARQEAQQALADVRTGEAASGAQAACSGCHKLQQELSSLQSQVAELQSASCAEFEEVRHEGSGFIQLLASHVREAAAAADGATRRVGSMEQDVAAAVEEMRGRFEALATMPSELAQLRKELEERDRTINQLQQEVVTLRKGLILVHAAVVRPQQQQPPQQQQWTAEPMHEQPQTPTAPPPSFNTLASAVQPEAMLATNGGVPAERAQVPGTKPVEHDPADALPQAIIYGA